MAELEAITREEKYLGHMTGICKEMPNPPITRIERFLYELCKCTKGNISFPVDEEGQIIIGEEGQILASDGQGGLVWVDGGGAEWKASLKGVLQGDIAHPVFPDDLEAIKEYAFYENDVIASETLPDSVKRIGDYAFYYSSVALVSLPASLETIGYSAFTGCENLTISELPNGIKTICGSAFAQCKNITIETIPDSVKNIDMYAFQGCENLRLTNINVQKDWLNSTFQGCINLAITEIPEGTERIYYNVFKGCTGITELTFPSTIKEIANNAFEGCDNLTTINVPWSEGAIENAPWGAVNATINYDYIG